MLLEWCIVCDESLVGKAESVPSLPSLPTVQRLQPVRISHGLFFSNFLHKISTKPSNEPFIMSLNSSFLKPLLPNELCGAAFVGRVREQTYSASVCVPLCLQPPAG